MSFIEEFPIAVEIFGASFEIYNEVDFSVL